ncbi:MAG: hypothetical protein IT379_13820 [Deltaproteobacteria bacterium]|nr:hypothetical protein [Deltaproteobacteria bacterium]
MTLDPHALRVRTVAALGSHADALSGTVLARAEIEVEPDAARWESSHGLVRAHLVTLYVPADLVLALEARPAVRDEIVAAFARALGDTPGHALADLRIEPVTPSRGVDRGPYR